MLRTCHPTACLQKLGDRYQSVDCTHEAPPVLAVSYLFELSLSLTERSEVGCFDVPVEIWNHHPCAAASGRRCNDSAHSP